MSCATVATETQFQVVTATSNSLSTSFSTTVTTLPPSLVTTASNVCSQGTANSSCSPTQVVVTGAVSTSIISVPVTVTVPVTFTSSNPTRTLFSTSCSSSATSISSTSTSQSSLSTPTPTASTSSSISDSTSQLTLVSSSATTTLSNGSIVTTEVVVTSTSPPSSTVVSNESASPSPSLNTSGAGGSKSSSKTAPIVGGVVGGLIGLLAIIGGIWYIWRRSKRWNDIFQQEEDQEKRRSRMSIDGEDVQPRPYHYGLVGHSGTPSPPGSPPLGAVNPGHSPSNSLSILNAPPLTSRSSSGVELTSRSLSDLGSANAPQQSGHTRPSLSAASSGAASTRPLLERPVNHSRMPSSWSVDGQRGVATGDLLGVGRTQVAPSSPRPRSAGGALQSATTAATSAESVPPLQSSPISEKRKLLASLPSGAAAPTLPSPTLGGSSSPVEFPLTESRPPPIKKRNPNRPSSAKNSDTAPVIVDQGSSGTTAENWNDPPAYSPT